MSVDARKRLILYKEDIMIQDKFSGLNISRQRKYQLRKHRDNKCIVCGKPVNTKYHCRYHAKEVSIMELRYLRNKVR